MSVNPGCALSTNSLLACMELAVAGQGLAHLPCAFAASHVADGSLVPLLEAYAYTYPALYFYYPVTSRQNHLIRAFVDFYRHRG